MGGGAGGWHRVAPIGADGVVTFRSLHNPPLTCMCCVQPDLPSFYKTMHCLVLPTEGEGWGRPVSEAMAMGLPVIGAWLQRGGKDQLGAVVLV
jgi:glycosyltransferase involved in cell wall biosynthesis